MAEPVVARVLNALFGNLVLLFWGCQANEDLCKQGTSSVSVPFLKANLIHTTLWKGESWGGDM